jgi:sarcosine oxidase delta subunit
MTTKARRARARALRASSYLTAGYAPELAAQMRATRPGQAHWAGSGPSGKNCGSCSFLGYFKQHRNASGDTVRSEHTGGCRRYFELTGHHGPVVPANAGACRHFESKQTTENGK